MDRTVSYTQSWDRQPVPAPLDRLPSPTGYQWAAVAAVWLLAEWTRDGTPGWRGECVTARAPERTAQQWREPPPGLAAICGLPAEPVDATVLLGLVQPAERQPYEPTRPQDEVTAELITLLGTLVPVTDRRGAALLAYLAGRLAGPYTDLLRVSTGGADLHLVQRDSSGNVLRVTVAPAPATEPPPVLASDGGDAALRTRIGSLITLLAAELWVNNNNPVKFRVWVGPRDAADPIEAAARWWTSTREEEPEGPPQLRALTVEELDRGLYTVVRSSLLELFDGSWDGVEEWPHVPPDHVTRHLYRDLIDQLLARTTTPDGPPHLLAAGYLPIDGIDEEAGDEHDYAGTVLFVGPTDVAVLDIDLSS
ncbi:hypothetical protein [Dactylosporangium sp. NPDC005555]|uniref:hypothetical protein n=1 Tax=Dactylosporangium sp. NPDC005555 TaxID=3154889 RepID=UPI0033BA1063